MWTAAWLLLALSRCICWLVPFCCSRSNGICSVRPMRKMSMHHRSTRIRAISWAIARCAIHNRCKPSTRSSPSENSPMQVVSVEFVQFRIIFTDFQPFAVARRIGSRPHLSSEPTYAHGVARSHFSINHDIDTQSIYGFDAINHRQPAFSMPDQDAIVRNFSRRTLCNNPYTLNSVATAPVNRRSYSNHNLSASLPQVPPPKPLRWFQIGSRDVSPPKPLRLFEIASLDSQLMSRKPLRWFESGSLESVHLGSCMEIFKEPTQPVQPIATKTRRKSSLFTPFQRQSLFVQAIKKNILTSNRLDSESETKPKEDAIDETITFVPDHHIDEVYECDDEIIHRSPCCAAFKWVVEFFDLDLLRDNIYLNLMIGMSISLFAEINFAILTPFILSDLDFDSSEIPLILSVIAIADLISRFFSPFVAEYFKWTTQMAYTVSLAMLIITRAGELLPSFDESYQKV